MYYNNFFKKDGIIYDTTYGYSKQYSCENFFSEDFRVTVYVL